MQKKYKVLIILLSLIVALIFLACVISFFSNSNFEKEDIENMFNLDTEDYIEVGKYKGVKCELHEFDIKYDVAIEIERDLARHKAKVLTTAFVLKYTDYKSVDEYKSAIKKRILKENELSQKKEVVDKVLDKISKKSKLNNYPQGLYKYLIKSQEDKDEINAEIRGLELEQYYSTIGFNEALREEYIENNSKKLVKRILILEYIADKEDIEITDKEVKDKVNDIKKGYQKSSKLLENRPLDIEFEARYSILLDKVGDFLYRNSKF